MPDLPRGLPRPGSRRRPAADGLADRVVPSVAGAAVAAAASAGLVLAARRMAGGFSGGAPGLAWMTLGSGLAAMAAANLVRGDGMRLAAAVAARVGLVAGVAAVSVPARANGWESALPLAAAVGIALLPRAGAAARAGRGRRMRGTTSRGAGPRALVRRAGRPTPLPEAGTVVPPRPSPADDPTRGRLRHRLERYESADGGDCLSGHVRLSIPAGGRATHAHVGFCPAFSATPVVQVSTEYDGVEAVVAAAEVVPWGVRIECRLDEPAEEPLEIPVDLLVTGPRP